jgi:hypothetical protein
MLPDQMQGKTLEGFESTFYSHPDLREVKLTQKQQQTQTLNLAALIE